ncbi:MucR family transcriptional regulator [Methylorubrum thiocyanatum]|uniref:MucR family transcriptional regulator n=1 Tax=Methylorubrum thiocyanatum TaxID=47958 RepID=UPI003F8065AF
MNFLLMHALERRRGGIIGLNRPQASDDDRIVEGTVRIVKGYVASNRLPPEALVPLIMTVARALRSAPHSEIEPIVPRDAFVESDRRRKQAAPRALTRKEIADSIHETFLVCFEDNMPYRMLSMHPRLFGLTPDAGRLPREVGPAGRLPDYAGIRPRASRQARSAEEARAIRSQHRQAARELRFQGQGAGAGR